MKSSKFLFNIILSTIVFLSASQYCFSRTINFAIASDIHYSTRDFSDTERNLSKAPKALQGFVDRVNENDYDFVIFLGDNIDKSNKENLLSFLKVVRNINTPYYLVMGNHDVHKISGLEKKEYLEILSKNSKYQKKAKELYYFYPASDVIVIVLDSVSSGMPTAHGIFTPKTLKWLDEVLSKNENKKALIFQHVPYVTPYDNPSHEIMAKNEYRAVLSRHDNVLAVISGHYHKEAVNKDEKGVMHISAPALFVEPYYYVDMTLKYDKAPFQKGKNFKLDGITKPAI